MRSRVSSVDLTRARLARALPGVAHNPRTVLHESAGAALVEIRDLASGGRIAYVRDRLRGVLPRDVRHALRTAEACHLQDHGRWRVEGTDLSGDKVTVFVAVKDGVLVVTASQGAGP